MTCKHYYNCAHYCALTESCDYMLDTGKRRPHSPGRCPGYPIYFERRFKPLLLPNSSISITAGRTGGRVNV